jgi:hypothetical protein
VRAIGARTALRAKARARDLGARPSLRVKSSRVLMVPWLCCEQRAKLGRNMLRSSSFFAALSIVTGLAAGCASGPKVYSKQIIDRPVGERVVPGPAKSTSYMANVTMEHNIAHVSVLERSECPTIKVRIVERIEETLDDGKVVERVDKGAHEVAETLPTLMQCEARYSRAAVALQYGADTYPLGSTGDHGELDVDLASALKVNTRGIDLSEQTAVLLVNNMPAGRLSMVGLLKQQQRLDAIIAQLSSLLGKDGTKLNDADVTNASMLYEEMRELAPDDARTIALQRRYVEVVGGFRDVQRTAALKRNLGALSEAKELLIALGAPGAVPAYVQVSIASDGPTADSIAWARAQALVALRGQSALCAGGFDWSRVSQLQGPARLAFSYLRYAFDAQDLGWVSAACAH